MGIPRDDADRTHRAGAARKAILTDAAIIDQRTSEVEGKLSANSWSARNAVDAASRSGTGRHIT